MTKYDEHKGRAKEAAGKLTGDRELQREGKVDRAAGKVKEGVDKVKDALKRKDRDHRRTRGDSARGDRW
jgi:uncharacterized protein YjbJ (UPF0337 family)